MSNDKGPQKDELKIDWNGYQAVVAYDFKNYQWDVFVAGEYIDSRGGLSAAVNDAVGGAIRR